MQERVKLFTFVSRHGETVVEPSHEDRINQWLAQTDGQITHIGQSECKRTRTGQHVTTCVWYVADPPPESD